MAVTDVTEVQDTATFSYLMQIELVLPAEAYELAGAYVAVGKDGLPHLHATVNLHAPKPFPVAPR